MVPVFSHLQEEPLTCYGAQSLGLPLPIRRTGPSIPWTTEEDEALKAAVVLFDGRNWKGISSKVPRRSHSQCFQRWHKVLRPGLHKGRWTALEDQQLRLCIAAQLKELSSKALPKRICWSQLSRIIKTRTAKQCRERWLNNLSPDINRSPWTPDEDVLILTYAKIYPNRWAPIAKKLKGRTENAVKLRFFLLKRRGLTEAHEARPGFNVATVGTQGFASQPVEADKAVLLDNSNALSYDAYRLSKLLPKPFQLASGSLPTMPTVLGKRKSLDQVQWMNTLFPPPMYTPFMNPMYVPNNISLQPSFQQQPFVGLSWCPTSFVGLSSEQPNLD